MHSGEPNPAEGQPDPLGITTSADRAFAHIAPNYRGQSLVQASAGVDLLGLLALRRTESVLDLGCGPGDMTAVLRGETDGEVVGIDASAAMIDAAREAHGHLAIDFIRQTAETLDARDRFDAIYCNSTFQWLQPEPALAACYRALKPGGRMVVQAPARNNYCPVFIKALKSVMDDPRTGPTFARFITPWTLLDSAGDYRALFQSAGFAVPRARIEMAAKGLTVDEAMGAFESGAAAGYLNPDCYRTPLPDGYQQAFCDAFLNGLQAQTGKDGQIDLTFFRVFLLAVK